ncbi:MAG: D-2-hydroxyacid dehydrogenase [Chloroflexi bacterium]|mgnify:CR=1 FL=1|nr:D-2-hydroxyacid dehydrogenase [Chloroflexota bacterium]
MKIVVLDGYTLNPGDLSWEGIEALGELTVHDRIAPEDTVAAAREADVILLNKAPLTSEMIAQLPNLKLVSVLATGFNIVDIEAALAHGVTVCNIPTYGTRSVAQMTFAHLCNLTLHVAEHSKAVREGRWTNCPDFSFWDWPLIEIADKTMGIIGFGRIGRSVAEVALAFGMKVLANDSFAGEPMEGVKLVELDQLFSESDVVSLHCPLTPETRGIVNAQRLAQMKPTAYLINTSRGPLVVAQDLADALNAGRLAGAGVDVLEVEPPPADNPLLSAKNCVITPHIAWATTAARSRLMDMTVTNIRAFMDGKPQNVVN